MICTGRKIVVLVVVVVVVVDFAGGVVLEKAACACAWAAAPLARAVDDILLWFIFD